MLIIRPNLFSSYWVKAFVSSDAEYVIDDVSFSNTSIFLNVSNSPGFGPPLFKIKISTLCFLQILVINFLVDSFLVKLTFSKNFIH